MGYKFFYYLLLSSIIIPIFLYKLIPPSHFVGGLIGFMFLIGLAGSLVGVAATAIKNAKKKRQQLLMAGAYDIASLTPLQFEKYCGILLEDSGWRVEYTDITGDYGADIIAHKNGQKMIVQCKHYTSNVGVSAVQEAFSAKAYYHAHKAIVVASRGGFTNAARSLAMRTGVKVLSPVDLKKL